MLLWLPCVLTVIFVHIPQIPFSHFENILCGIIKMIQIFTLHVVSMHVHTLVGTGLLIVCMYIESTENYWFHTATLLHVVAVSGIEGDGCSNSDDDSADMPNTNVSDPLHFNAMFTLSLAAKHNLSQSAVDSVISSTDVLLENHLEFFKQQLKLKLTEIDVDPGVIDDINMSTFMSAFASHPKQAATEHMAKAVCCSSLCQNCTTHYYVCTVA